MSISVKDLRQRFDEINHHHPNYLATSVEVENLKVIISDIIRWMEEQEAKPVES